MTDQTAPPVQHEHLGVTAILAESFRETFRNITLIVILGVIAFLPQLFVFGAMTFSIGAAGPDALQSLEAASEWTLGIGSLLLGVLALLSLSFFFAVSFVFTAPRTGVVVITLRRHLLVFRGRGSAVVRRPPSLSPSRSSLLRRRLD